MPRFCQLPLFLLPYSRTKFLWRRGNAKSTTTSFAFNVCTRTTNQAVSHILLASHNRVWLLWRELRIEKARFVCQGFTHRLLSLLTILWPAFGKQEVTALSWWCGRSICLHECHCCCVILVCQLRWHDRPCLLTWWKYSVLAQSWPFGHRTHPNDCYRSLETCQRRSSSPVERGEDFVPGRSEFSWVSRQLIDSVFSPSWKTKQLRKIDRSAINLRCEQPRSTALQQATKYVSLGACSVRIMLVSFSERVFGKSRPHSWRWSSDVDEKRSGWPLNM